MPAARIAGTVSLGALAAMGARYAAARQRADTAWARRVETRLTDIGEVDEVRILPLVERLGSTDVAVPGGLQCEPGLSYLVEAGGTRLLFDAGLNLKARADSPLLTNARRLGVDLGSLDGVVISHLHPDHVGGAGPLRRRSFAFSPEEVEPRGMPAYVPTRMQHSRADVARTTAPRVVAPGIAVLPPLPGPLFVMGPVFEQAMVVNVRGYGLVLVSGCGHPAIERVLALTEQVLDVPVAAVVGGLHLPVHPLGTPLVPQAVLGNPHPPWHPISERDAAEVIEQIRARGPRLVALSGHDSTPWTYDEFGRVFGERYRTVRVGEEIRVAA